MRNPKVRSGQKRQDPSRIQHASAVIPMEVRAKNGDDSYRLSDPDDETYLLTVQCYDRASIINACLDSSIRFVDSSPIERDFAVLCRNVQASP